MRTTPKLIQSIREKAGNGFSDVLMAQELNAISDTENDIFNVEQAMRDLLQKYEKDLKELKIKKREIQKKCKHYSTSYNPDPSGNNDSYNSCDICGLEY